MKYKVIERPAQLEGLHERFYNPAVLATDTETTGLCPFQDKLRLLQLCNGEETIIIDVFKVGTEATADFVRPVLTDPTKKKILHNAKFDLKFIKQQLGIDVETTFDTFIASQIIEGGVKQEGGYHALGGVSVRYADRELDKSLQVSDWSGEIAPEQFQYAAGDVDALFPIREKQIEYLKKYGLTKCAKLEFEAILPIAWLELSGFYLDIERWVELAEQHKKDAEEAADKIFKELAPFVTQGNLLGEPDINLNSHQQIQKYFRMAGVPMPDSTKEFFMTPLKKDYPLVEWLLDYRGHIKSYDTFGDSFRQFVNPVTGRVHGDFWQYGTETGRLSVKNPNLNQIPSDNHHRACWRVEEGNSLLSNDFSQEELRILADFSGDPGFREIFRSKQDFHKMSAAMLFKMTPEQVDKDKQARDLAKRCNFAIAYCAGPGKLAMSAGIPMTEAQMIIRNYFDTFKGVKRWMDFQKMQVLRTRCSRSGSGRMIRYEFDDADKQAVAAAQRYAVNGPIQGTGADILKRSLRLFYDGVKDYRDKVKLINIVHDEMNVECPDELIPVVQPILKNAMVSAGQEYIRDIEVVVDEDVSKFWRKQEDENIF